MSTYSSISKQNSKCVALTFDDGPHPTNTPRLLDILKQKQVPATFFVLGQDVENYPQIVKRAAQEGHLIGNHTYSHVPPNGLPGVPDNTVRDELERTRIAIERALGGPPKRLVMRPPYGEHNGRVDQVINQLGYDIIMWSVDPRDWESRNAQAVENYVLNNVKAGDIILLHDIHASTIDAVSNIID